MEQYRALMAAEDVSLEFDDGGIERIAELAWQVNEGTENIGARRLHTVMERLLEPCLSLLMSMQVSAFSSMQTM